jgi:hypothetical protein
MTRAPFITALICALCSLTAACQADATDPSTNTTANTSASTRDADDTGHNHNTATDVTFDAPDTSSQTLCDIYCATAEEVCTGANRLYVERSTCMGACANMREGTAGQRTGDTVQCRIFQLELGHAAPSPAALPPPSRAAPCASTPDRSPHPK